MRAAPLLERKNSRNRAICGCGSFFCSLGLYDLYGKADRQVHHIEREAHDEDAGEHQQARD